MKNRLHLALLIAVPVALGTCSQDASVAEIADERRRVPGCARPQVWAAGICEPARAAKGEEVEAERPGYDPAALANIGRLRPEAL